MNLNVDTCGEVELLELVHGAGGRVDDVEEALVSADLELIGGLLVDVHRAVDGELLNPGGQRDGAGNFSSSALGSLNDLDGRAIDGPVVERAKANADFLIHGRKVFWVGGFFLVTATALGDEFVYDVTRNFLEAARLHGVGGTTG